MMEIVFMVLKQFMMYREKDTFTLIFTQTLLKQELELKPLPLVQMTELLKSQEEEVIFMISWELLAAMDNLFKEVVQVVIHSIMKYQLEPMLLHLLEEEVVIYITLDFTIYDLPLHNQNMHTLSFHKNMKETQIFLITY